MTALLGLLLVTSIDGEAALRHASALAALGPHPWGSPRVQVAAQYVAAQFREAGLTEVELQRFERAGVVGTNVIATRRAAGEEFVLVAAHHDTAPGAPGAYDDGGGVGILIELARSLGREPSRTRTIVFASFDAEESWASGKGRALGSRAYIERLGPRARDLVAAFAIEMSGWKGGTPIAHPIAYADPREKGRTVIASAWLVRAALEGSREAGAPLGLGDPLLSWLYQPAVRTFRVALYGDDLSFLQAGLPGLFASDSSFSAFYPSYHQPSDTADQLDPAALERMGRSALGVVRALERGPKRGPEERHWFAAFGRVVDLPALLAIGVASLLPGLRLGLVGGGWILAARLAQAALFAVLLWRHPVPALWLLLLPHVLAPWRLTRWTIVLSLAPAASLLAIGAAGAARGVVEGVWLAPWEVAVAVVVVVFAFVGAGRRGKKADRGRGRLRR